MASFWEAVPHPAAEEPSRAAITAHRSGSYSTFQLTPGMWVLHVNILVACWENQKIYPLVGGWASPPKVRAISCQVKGRNSKCSVTDKAFCWGLCRVLPAPSTPQCAGCAFLIYCTGWSCVSLKFCLWLKRRMVCFKTWKALSCPHSIEIAIEIWSWKTERKKEREQEH